MEHMSTNGYPCPTINQSINQSINPTSLIPWVECTLTTLRYLRVLRIRLARISSKRSASFPSYLEKRWVFGKRNQRKGGKGGKERIREKRQRGGKESCFMHMHLSPGRLFFKYCCIQGTTTRIGNLLYPTHLICATSLFPLS